MYYYPDEKNQLRERFYNNGFVKSYLMPLMNVQDKWLVNKMVAQNQLKEISSTFIQIDFFV